MKQKFIVAPFLLYSLVLGQHAAQATEGGSSYYFPGAAATFGAAVAPDTGFLFADQILIYDGSANKAVLRGHVNLDLESSAVYNYFAGFYTFQESIIGGRLQIGVGVPVGHVDVSVGLDTSLGSRNLTENDSGFGDMLTSAALYWQNGDLHFKLVESVFSPTGDYASGNLANVGRNYWGFDTSFAMTWLKTETGTEISIIPGIMFNTKNSKTDYQSGNEFHIDVTVNQFLAKTYAVGAHGYYYSQVSDDSGSGAILGGFRGESLGVGPALLWMPEFGKGKLSLIAKWLHDVDDKHRMQGDSSQLVVGYKF